jgi:hypothetical protein
MEGGIAILLALILLAVIGGAVFLFAGGRGAVAKARKASGADDASGPRPIHENPHPEQQQRERSRLFPESS